MKEEKEKVRRSLDAKRVKEAKTKLRAFAQEGKLPPVFFLLQQLGKNR